MQRRALLLLLLIASPVFAANVSWDDGGAGKSWTTGANWDTNSPPGSDDVFVGNLPAAIGDSTTIDADFGVNSLTISAGADVDTAKFLLKVNGPIAITGAGSTLIATEHGDGLGADALSATSITAGLNGAFVMNGGRTVLADGSAAAADLVVGVNSFFSGFGELYFDDSYNPGSSPLVNDGSLTTQRLPGFSNTTRFVLSIDAADPGAPLDLDGFVGGGTVGVTSQTTLDINQPITAFGSTMTLNPGAEVDINNSWALNGTVSVNAGNPLAGVQPRATIDGGTVVVNPGAFVLANSGELVLDAATNFQPGSTLQLGLANSAITFNEPASVLGTFAVPSSPGLAINVNDTVTIANSFDWDGGEDAVTSVSPTGFLDINSPDISPSAVDDTFDGTLNITGGRVDVHATGGWQMAGVVNMAFGGGTAARLNGTQMTVKTGAQINLTSGFAQIDSPVVFEAGSITTVSAADNAALSFNREVTFEGLSGHTGDGRMRFFNNHVTVNGPTTISMGGDVLLDADAANHSSQLTLNDDLTVNAATIGVFGAASANPGTDLISIANTNARLTINQSAASSWTLGPAGAININGAGTVATSIAGDDLVVEGLVNVINTTRLGARIDVASGGEVNVNTVTTVPTAQLRLGGGSLGNPNTIAGGQISGGGELIAESGRALVGHGFIETDIRFLGTAQLVADGGQLFVNGDVIDAAVMEVTGPGSQLVLTRAYTSPTGSTMRLGGGLVTAGTGMTNNTTITGHGTINTVSLVNNGLIEATDGETLTITNTLGGPLDLDGSGTSGELDATDGDIVIQRALTDPFGGTVAVALNRMVEFQEGWTLGTNGQIVFAGGTLNQATIAGPSTQLDGSVSVSVPVARINGETRIGSTASVSIPSGSDRLQLLPGSVVEAGATFTGEGQLSLIGGSLSTLADGADVGITVGIAAALDIGEGEGVIGHATVFGFNGSSGAADLQIDIGGTDPSRHDRLDATFGAILGGVAGGGDLDIDLVGGFTPVLGDTFTIIDSSMGVVSGAFGEIDTTGAPLPAGLAWQVKYLGPRVDLEVILAGVSGDYNDNGIVDAADYTVWRDTLGSTTVLDADGNGNGIVDQNDYDLWVNNFGASSLSVAVPEPSTLLLLVGPIAVGASRRRVV